jgi:hypothetical protein
MPNFRLGLADNLDARVPSNQEVIYDRNGLPPLQWWVIPVNPNPLRNTATPVISCAADLINQPNVRTRKLRMHYPSAPNTVDHQILTVML